MAELYRVRVVRGGMVHRIELSGELDLAAQDAIRNAVREASFVLMPVSPIGSKVST